MDKEFSNSKKSFLRASTATVDPLQLHGRLIEIEANHEIFKSHGTLLSDDTIGNLTCEYDPSVHIVDYLPTPIVTPPAGQKNDDGKSKQVRSLVKRGKLSSLESIQDSMRHLGAQADSATTPGEQKKENSIQRRSLLASSSVQMKRLVSTESNMMCIDPEFDSVFLPHDMRMLALVSHNNMKHSMKQFVMGNKNVLKKFRLTGTNTTMTMLKEVFGNDPDIVYGRACKSGPLGGDAQLVAMAVTGELGGCIFFIDPMDAHPHSADIDCLVRQGNVHNILMMTNPCTAHVCMNACRVALKMGRMEMMPSFFFDLESPSVEAYKVRQNAVLQNAIARDSKRNNFPLFNTGGSRNGSAREIEALSRSIKMTASSGSYFGGNELVLEEDEMIEAFLKDH